MRLSCDGNLNDSFITRLLLSPLLKNFENLQDQAKLWARLGCSFFDSRGETNGGIGSPKVLVTGRTKV